MWMCLESEFFTAYEPSGLSPWFSPWICAAIPVFHTSIFRGKCRPMGSHGTTNNPLPSCWSISMNWSSVTLSESLLTLKLFNFSFKALDSTCLAATSEVRSQEVSNQRSEAQKNGSKEPGPAHLTAIYELLKQPGDRPPNSRIAGSTVWFYMAIPGSLSPNIEHLLETMVKFTKGFTHI